MITQKQATDAQYHLQEAANSALLICYAMDDLTRGARSKRLEHHLKKAADALGFRLVSIDVPTWERCPRCDVALVPEPDPEDIVMSR